MSRIDKSLLLQLLVLILRPAARFCLKHSIKLQDLTECAKKAYVDAASNHLKESGLSENVSRISVMTGVHRRDVQRLQSSGIDLESARDLPARVMGQWLTDKQFTTKSGQPRVLTEGFDGSEFHQLCSSLSTDIDPGTILFELRRIEAVVQTKGGIKLLHQSYVPAGDPLAGFSILANDCDSLIDAVEENTLFPGDLPQFHARTAYDNVDPAAGESIQRWILKEGHEFHRRVREFVSQFDRDINPDSNFKGAGIQVVIGAFSHIGKSMKRSRGKE